MCKEMEDKGLLKEAIDEAGQMVVRKMIRLLHKGEQHLRAQEVALAHVSMPSEKEPATLTQHQQTRPYMQTNSNDSKQDSDQPRVLSHQEFLEGLPNFQGIRIRGTYFPNLKLKK
jgi:DNA-binding PadR family transcriptional regulator